MLDLILINRFKSGDAHALDILINKYYDEIYNYFYYTIKDKDTALDLTQETFIKVFNAIASYNYKKAKFRTWLKKIATNVYLNYLNSKDYKDYTYNVEFEEYMYNKQDYHLLEEIINKDTIRLLLNSLPEELKEIIILRYFQDLKIKEISKVLEMKESNVKAKLYKGLKIMKKVVTKYDL